MDIGLTIFIRSKKSHYKHSRIISIQNKIQKKNNEKESIKSEATATLQKYARNLAKQYFQNDQMCAFVSCCSVRFYSRICLLGAWGETNGHPGTKPQISKPRRNKRKKKQPTTENICSKEQKARERMRDLQIPVHFAKQTARHTHTTHIATECYCQIARQIFFNRC